MIGLAALGASGPALRAEQQTPQQQSPQQTSAPPPAQTPAAQAPDQSADEAKTIWSGVFTDDQAQRGRTLYNKYCQSCHGAELNGGEMAPPLAGSLFITNWDSQTVGDLEERIRITMPQGDEGSLSRQTVADILAAIFAANGAPAGQTELPRELQILKLIKITPKPQSPQ